MRLVLDTSASVSAAVLDGDRLLAAHATYAPRSHVELLVPLVRQALADAGVTVGQLTGVVAGQGPGPFTGLRVALVSAATMGLALGVPTHGVCSLDGLAVAAARQAGLGPGTEFVVATDARRKEVYWARYRHDGSHPQRVTGPDVGPAGGVDLAGTAGCVGRGVALYPDALPQLPGTAELLDPQAADLGLVAHRELVVDGLTPRPLEPLYLRRPDATVPANPPPANPPPANPPLA